MVERPASVAKEPLENAIDAGATVITPLSSRGGIQQLQIADNGSGIEAEYIDVLCALRNQQNCQMRSNTSTPWLPRYKRCSRQRPGEIITEADEYACCYRIEGGEPRAWSPAPARGTTVTVNDLFYTPARMKSFEKDVSEGTQKDVCMKRCPTRKLHSASAGRQAAVHRPR